MHPEARLAEFQPKVESAVRLAMCRALDVAKIGGMRAGEGRSGLLEVTKAAGADCELTIQELGALVNGTHSPSDFSLRGWGSPGAEIQSTLRGMFPPQVPFLHENF